MTPVSIFVSTFNRTDTLLRTMLSYRKFTTPYEVTIVDNGSNWHEARELLTELAEWPEVRKIERMRRCHALPQVAANIHTAIRRRYRESRKASRWYAVTDADICFDGSDPDTLAAYIDLAEHTEDAPGPHLRVTDIPAGYPLRSRVVATESHTQYAAEQLWYDEIGYSIWSIDTTFHLFPAQDGFPWRKMDTLRVGPPYDAMHLDWYVDIHRPTVENVIYLLSPISSWGASWLRGFWVVCEKNPEAAYLLAMKEARAQERLVREDNTPYIDLNNGWFLASWCHQYGIGVEENREMALRCLEAAIPSWSPCRRHRDDWSAMVFDGDFSCLGW